MPFCRAGSIGPAWEMVSGSSGENRRGSRGEAFRHHGVVAAMSVHLAVRALLFDVSQLAARGELAVAADYAAASERPKPEEPHETHGLRPPSTV